MVTPFLLVLATFQSAPASPDSGWAIPASPTESQPYTAAPGVTTPDAVPSPPPDFTLTVDATARFLAFRGSTGAPGSGTDTAVYGARNQLAFDVQPIVVAGVRGGITVPTAKGWEAFGLRGSYETDRAFRSGGTISSSNSLASSLGATGASADLIDAAIHVSGVGFEAEYATFSAGRVQVQDVTTGTPSADAPLTFTRTKLEASFDLGPYITNPPASRPAKQRRTLVALADYYSVQLPRIIYLTQDLPYGGAGSNGSPPTRTTVVLETPPQPVTLAIAALGVLGREVLAQGPGGYWRAQATGLLGVAEPQFYLPARLDAPMSSTNRVASGGTAFAAIGRVGTDFEVRLTGDVLSLWLGGELHGEFYYASLNIPGEYGGQVGFQDFFVSGRGFLSLHYDQR